MREEDKRNPADRNLDETARQYTDPTHQHAFDHTPQRKLNAPLWLAAAMAVVGLIAITTLDPRKGPEGVPERNENARIMVNGTAYTSNGQSEVTYPQNQMVLVPRTGEGGFQIYRNRNQGGGGGATGSNVKPVPPDLIFLKTGTDTYLPLVPVTNTKRP